MLQQKQHGKIPSVVNSPWLLVTIPLVGFAVWLANNTGVITNNWDKPYLLLAGPVLVASILVGTFCKTIVSSFQSMSTKVMTRTGFFWAVNIVFMAVSVLHAGAFFGITGNGHDVPVFAQYLGFAVSFFLDLVTIILIQAMLEARYRGEDGRAHRFLFFIAISCATSTFANLAISLNDFSATVNLPHAPLWVQVAAPYVLASFPLFVIMMSLAAEMIINVRPLDSLNEEEYEADEKKRIHLLAIRATYLQKQADEELRILAIRAQMRMNSKLQKGKLPQGFRWPWEKPLDVDQLVTGVAKQLEGVYASQTKQVEQEKQVLAERYATTCQLVETNVAQLIAGVTTKLEGVYETETQKLEEEKAKLSQSYEQDRQGFEEQTAQMFARLETHVTEQNEAYQSRLATQCDRDISLIKSHVATQAEERITAAIESVLRDIQMGQKGVESAPSDAPDLLEQALEFVQNYPESSEEDLARYLELKTPARAHRFYRAAKAITGTNLQALTEQRSVEDTQTAVVADGTLTEDQDPQTDEIKVPQNEEQNGTAKGRQDGTKSSVTKRNRKRKPMTNAEAAKELKCTERHIRNLRSNGTLLPDTTDEHLISATSFNAYLARRSRQAVRV